jgi:hypothetical protein
MIIRIASNCGRIFSKDFYALWSADIVLVLSFIKDNSNNEPAAM